MEMDEEGGGGIETVEKNVTKTATTIVKSEWADFNTHRVTGNFESALKEKYVPCVYAIFFNVYKIFFYIFICLLHFFCFFYVFVYYYINKIRIDRLLFSLQTM